MPADRRLSIIVVCLALVLAPTLMALVSPEWGFFGHRRINRLAVFTLDPDMMPFFRGNLEYLTDHAVDPDKRRYATKHEAVRHYIDIDHWGELPFDNVPRDWAEALLWKAEVQVIHRGDTSIWVVDTIVRNGTIDRSPVFDPTVAESSSAEGAVNYLRSNRRKTSDADSVYFRQIDGKESFSLSVPAYRNFWYRYLLPQYYEEEWTVPCSVIDAIGWRTRGYCSEVRVIDHFSEYGILPYHLLQMKRNLTRAFESRNPERILRYAAEFGHYIGDAHVPLHTTENYNGQLTNQIGIHGFWESRIPELMADAEYDFFVGKADYIDDPRTYFWDMVLDSHALVDSVLQSERRLSERFPADQQYCYEDRLDATVRTYCPEYARAWAEMMRGMVEERFRASIHAVGSIWYTCWVDAGQPELNDLLRSEAKTPERDSIDAAFQRGDIKGRPHDG